MGIHGLSKLLSDEAPGCMKEVDLDSLTGRKVAVDASMAMYQFLVRVSLYALRITFSFVQHSTKRCDRTAPCCSLQSGVVVVLSTRMYC